METLKILEALLYVWKALAAALGCPPDGSAYKMPESSRFLLPFTPAVIILYEVCKRLQLHTRLERL